MGDARKTRRELAAIDAALRGEQIDEAVIATVVREVRAGMPQPAPAFLTNLDARLATLAEGELDIAHLVGGSPAATTAKSARPAPGGRRRRRAPLAWRRRKAATARPRKPSWARRHPVALAALGCTLGGLAFVSIAMPIFNGQKQSGPATPFHGEVVASSGEKDKLELPRFEDLSGREGEIPGRDNGWREEDREQLKSGYVNESKSMDLENQGRQAMVPTGSWDGDVTSTSGTVSSNVSVTAVVRQPERSVQHAASITIATRPGKVQSVVGRVNDVVTEAGGFVAASNFEVLRGDGRARIDLRVPTSELQDVLDRLAQLGTPVQLQHESLDITEPVEDARDELRQARAELAGVLRQLARTTNSVDRAQLRREAQLLRRDIARLRGNRNRLVRQASQVPVSVTIQAGDSAAKAAKKDRDPTSVGQALDRSRAILGFMLAAMLIGFTALAPPLALLAIATWLWRRRPSRRY